MKTKTEIQHDHSCFCGTGAHVPHRVNTTGCVRFMTAAPIFKADARWFVDGDEVTDYTLRHQRGYFQHPCGCWSRHGGSVNSIDA